MCGLDRGFSASVLVMFWVGDSHGGWGAVLCILGCAAAPTELHPEDASGSLPQV